MQRYAVWFGGSIAGVHPSFYNVAKSKADYDEHGGAIFRQNVAFKDSL